MSLDDIQLSATLVAKLYEKCLIDNGKSPAEQPVKKVMIISEALSESNHDDRILLTSILKACHLSTEDVEMITPDTLQERNAWEACIQKGPERILLFGAFENKTFPAPKELFIQKGIEGKLFMRAPALQEIAGNKQLKLQLWNSLQDFFNLNRS